jgi:hypothetical protein
MTKFIVRGDIPKDPALIVKNHLLLCPGVWKGQKISREAIINGLQNTNWDDSAVRAVIYSHKTNNETQYFGDASPDIWVGNHTIPKYLTLSDGVPVEGLYADLELYDEQFARKVVYGKMRCGTSAGMEYDYRNDMINKFINQSIVSNPACKLAYLNLSEEESDMNTLEPTFLNLEEAKEKPKEESNSETTERRDDDKAKMDEERIIALEKQISEMKELLSKQKEEKPKEPEVKEQPKEDPKPEPKVDKSSEPVVIERETIREVDNNKEVVEAINKMSENFSNEIKRVARPETVAETDPHATMKSSEDEVTDKLLQKYDALHPDQR